MPSPTGVTTLVRKKKKTLQGKRRKKEMAKRGTINYYKALIVSAVELANRG